MGSAGSPLITKIVSIAADRKSWIASTQRASPSNRRNASMAAPLVASMASQSPIGGDSSTKARKGTEAAPNSVAITSTNGDGKASANGASSGAVTQSFSKMRKGGATVRPELT